MHNPVVSPIKKANQLVVLGSENRKQKAMSALYEVKHDQLKLIKSASFKEIEIFTDCQAHYVNDK